MLCDCFVNAVRMFRESFVDVSSGVSFGDTLEAMPTRSPLCLLAMLCAIWGWAAVIIPVQKGDRNPGRIFKHKPEATHRSISCGVIVHSPGIVYI